MKKKHTKYKSSLLVALLSLYSLSSCVNTRQTLSNEEGDHFQRHNNHNATYTVNPHGEDHVTLINIKPNRDSIYTDAKLTGLDNSKETNSCNWKKKLVISLVLVSAAGLVSVPVGCALGLSLCPLGGISLLPNNTTLSINPNSTFIVPGHPFNATNRDDGRRGRMYNLEKLDVYTSMLNSSLAQLAPMESTSTESPSTEDLLFQEMTIYQLYGQIIKEDFDLAILRDWFKDGLSPNMEDTHNARTLFMLVIDHYRNIKKNDSKAVKIITEFLETGKINFSKKDTYGYTVWNYVKSNKSLKRLFAKYKQKK